MALSVETRRSLQLTEEERDRIADTLRLTELLGGEAITAPASAHRIADDIIGFARANNVTQIIVGKSTRSRWFEILHGSIVHDLVRRSGNISVHVIAGDELAGEPVPRKTVRTAEEAASLDVRSYAFAFLAVAIALGVAELIQILMGLENVDLVFLIAVVAVAVRFGLWPSLFASAIASLCYNFFFLPPIYTFTISDPVNLAAFGFFILVAVIVSHFAARGRTQTVVAHGRVRTLESLYAFSRKLAGVGTLDDVLWATAYQTALMLNVRVVLLLPENGSIAVKAGYPPEDMLDDADIAAAKWAWENNRAAGRGSDTLPGAKRLFLPMRTGRGAIGVVGIDSDKPGPLLTPDQRRLLDALIDQGALAIERVHLVEDVERAKRTMETDRLRSALLTSISHDLKTPLAAVLGAAGTLRSMPDALDDEAKADLITTIIDESERLNRFIANLLDMTRLEVRRGRAERGLARSRRDCRQCPRASEQDPREAPDRVGAPRRHADGGGRSGAVRAGSVQRTGQCGQVRTCRQHRPHPGLAGPEFRWVASAGRGRRDSARRPRACFRQVLPGEEGRSGSRRHRARAGDLARLRRSHARHHRSGQSRRSDRRRVRDQVADPTRLRAAGRGMTAAPLKILVVDDEPPIRKLLRMGLSTQGYQVLEAPNGKTALELLAQAPDLIILDLGLPDIQGLELLRTLRARNERVPIVVLSSRGDEAGKVPALDLGADDYVTKPFGMDELLARMRAALRHQLQVQGERPIFRIGELSVDLVRRIVKVADRDIKLSPKEYDLLRVLVQHAGKVLTHRFLLGELWDELTDAQYLRVYVRQLRQKLESDPERPHYILTETGVGYRLRAPD